MVKLLALQERSANVYAANRHPSDSTGVVEYTSPCPRPPAMLSVPTLEMGSIFHIFLLNAEYIFHCTFL